MNSRCSFVICFIGVFVFESILASETICTVHTVGRACPDPNETCYQQKASNDTGVCKCKPGYRKQSPAEPCLQTRPVTPDPHSDDKPTTPKTEHSSNVSGSAIAAGILIPLVLIVVVVGLLYSARRFHWLHWFRQLRQRRYDEVRIGQEDDDDPPIA
ncbi:uncharacterized protein LOC110836559 [Zootermopsis nevadensis]|uniref:EGF-like domain-containing protein n=1 Tax=Zootermopsis nevadensis TaxID=136037 RepID=A0A067R033_ZOONE|nr:uncharacterized protein LOC110836559 [Zootermopsis nevadensis]KDR12059.1 hypothetical protein L798_13592 [Zootermopsis nevadensis]